MATVPGADYKQLYTEGATSYVDPKTGKIVYLNYIGPEGAVLRPMNLTKTQPIPGMGGGSGLPDDILATILRGGSPNVATPAASPISAQFGELSKYIPQYADLYHPGAPATEGYFQDYLKSISAPSSVEQVQQQVETQGLQDLLGEIERGTAKSLASAKIGYGDQGLLGPGRTSDIVENALAQIRTGGERTKAGARTSVLLSQLGRAGEREKAAQAAFGKRYEVGATGEEAERGRESQAALTYQQLLSELLGTQYRGAITQSEGAAERGSRATENYINQVLNYALKKGELSQQDAQFYANLISGEQKAAADRQAAYDRALLSKGGGESERDWMDYLKFGIDTGTSLFGKGKSGGLIGKR